MARTLALRSSVIFVTVGAVVEVTEEEREERGREGVGCCSLRTIALAASGLAPPGLREITSGLLPLLPLLLPTSTLPPLLLLLFLLPFSSSEPEEEEERCLLFFLCFLFSLDLLLLLLLFLSLDLDLLLLFLLLPSSSETSTSGEE